jgi:hypothetical protein
MGQTKFKVLNKAGYSIYWNNSWESKNNYKKNFINFYFLDLFLEKIFNDSLFTQDYFFLKNKFTQNKTNYLYKNIIFFKKINVFKNNFKKLKIFNSKIWILNYQGWIIVNVYTFIIKNVDINTIKKKKNINNNFKYSRYSNKFNFL